MLPLRVGSSGREASKMMGRVVPPAAGLLYAGLLFDAAALAS
jgi:hypothetical protein